MDEDRFFKTIVFTVVVTLALICVGVVAVLMQGLFTPEIDNKEIFAIIGPAFNTVIGAFVGLLGGLSINKSKCKDKE